MEDQGYLNVEDEVDMLSLEYIFLPRINMHIALFLPGGGGG